MTKTRAVLVRHAVTEATGKVLYGRLPGYSLSEAGLVQAQETAGLLKGVQLGALFTSPLERAFQTANAISETTGAEVTCVDDLLDSDCGDLAGRTFEDLRNDPWWKHALQKPSELSFPGGESLAAMQDRVVKAIDQWRVDLAGHAFGVVTHRDLILATLAHYLGVGLDRFESFAADPATVSILEWNSDEVRLICVNHRGNLTEYFDG